MYVLNLFILSVENRQLVLVLQLHQFASLSFLFDLSYLRNQLKNFRFVVGFGFIILLPSLYPLGIGPVII